MPCFQCNQKYGLEEIQAEDLLFHLIFATMSLTII